MASLLSISSGRAAVAAFLFSYLLALPVPAAAEDLVFWIDAFVANKNPPGQTFIQPSPNLRSESILKPAFEANAIDHCFKTNDRDFSGDAKAASQMQSKLYLSVSGQHVTVIEEDHSAAPVFGVDCRQGTSGNCTAYASDKSMAFYDVKLSGSVLTFAVDASATNPCYLEPQPKVSYWGKFTVDISKRTITYYAALGGFSWFEAYLRHGDKQPTMIFNLTPTATPGTAASQRARMIRGTARYD